MPYLTRKSFILLLILALVPMLNAQRGARTRLIGLDQLTSESTQIVRGTVVSAKVEPHPDYPNLMTVAVKFRVEKTFKGEATPMLEFRQFIWDVRDFKEGAVYRRGDRLLLMLGPVSAAKLRSPIGLGQGRFRIQKDASGNQTAINETGNAGLFITPASRASVSKMQVSKSTAQMVNENRGGAMRLGDLETVVQAFVKNPPARSAQ